MAKDKLAIYECPKTRIKQEGGPLEVCGSYREKVHGLWHCRVCEPEVFRAAGVPPPSTSTVPIIPRQPNGTELMMERMRA